MPKLSINATQLVNPDVGGVAMVKRGANRIPFRIMKEDKSDMIDLTRITNSIFQKREVAPVLVGVALSKTANAEAIMACLSEAGVDLTDMVKSEANGVVSLTKSDSTATEDQVVVIKMDDDVALVITGPEEIVKSISCYDWESTSFSEIMQKGTFAPSIGMAQQMLQQTFSNIMEKASDSSELAKMMKAAVGEFESYIVTLAKGLPKSIFKAEQDLMKMDADKKKKPADAKDEDKKDEVKKEEISANPVHGNGTDHQSGTKVTIAGTKDGNIDENPVHGNGTPNQSGTKVDLGTKSPDNDVEGSPVAHGTKSSTTPVKKEDDADPMAAFAEMLKTAMTEFTTVVKTDMAALSTRLDAVAVQVKKTDDALGGVVLGEPGDDPAPLMKRDLSAAPPLLDTAIHKLDNARPARADRVPRRA